MKPKCWDPTHHLVESDHIPKPLLRNQFKCKSCFGVYSCPDGVWKCERCCAGGVDPFFSCKSCYNMRYCQNRNHEI